MNNLLLVILAICINLIAGAFVQFLYNSCIVPNISNLQPLSLLHTYGIIMMLGIVRGLITPSVQAK